MRYGSVCSGIEAATAAWHPFGWDSAFFSEIDAAPRAVLAHHYPHVPCHGDFTTIGADDYGPIELLVGGTPCQSFSVAGLRGGLGDDRGNLALEYLRLADRKRPRWLVWENVPGVLSSNRGRDFGAILGGMVELGYGIAYRVLDAQHFGVPQRRRRVFVIGYLGDWRRAAAVLFERHSLQGHPAPGEGSRPGIAGTIEASLGRSRGAGTPVAALTSCGVGTCGADDNQAQAGHLICFSAKDHGADASSIAPTLRAGGHTASHANAGVMPAVAFQEAQTGCREYSSAGTLRAGGPGHDPVGTRLRIGSAVRRLTPRECERLQGFPDDFTLVPYRKGTVADGPRYKMLGNSMAVPVMRWIGERIQMVEQITQTERLAA